jgi:tRNA pseudouridine38-40 synthase
LTLFPLPGENETEAAPEGPLLRVVLHVAYDGSGFHGFARQPRQRTVGGELVAALEKMAQVGSASGSASGPGSGSGSGPGSASGVELVCAGRTDTGVHASGQVVHVDLPSALVLSSHRGVEPGDLSWLARSLSRQLGPEIAVIRCCLASEGFDARHSGVARRYRYSVLAAPAPPDPLLARTTWYVESELDLSSLRLATDAILGEHDFAGFCRQPAGKPAGSPITRRVLDIRWSRPSWHPGLLFFEIEANAFCHQMVRSLVGSLVSVGAGRSGGASIGGRLRSGSRSGAPTLAPPQGLCLLGVRYPPPYSQFSTLPG